MALIDVNWNPEPKELKRFSWISPVASLALAFGLHVLRGLDLRWCALIAGAGVIVGLSPFVSLTITKAFYRLLVGATLPIGLVMSFLLLSLFYFLLITPIGLFFRLIGRDPLKRRFDPHARTYWLTHESADKPERYFQQF